MISIIFLNFVLLTDWPVFLLNLVRNQVDELKERVILHLKEVFLKDALFSLFQSMSSFQKKNREKKKKPSDYICLIITWMRSIERFTLLDNLSFPFKVICYLDFNPLRLEFDI